MGPSNSFSEEDVDKTTSVDSESEICLERLEVQAISPAHDEINATSQSSGGWAITPANDDNHESSQTSGERAIPLLNNEIHSSSQTSGKRATPPSNEKIPPASNPCQPSEICILPPTNMTSEVCNRTNHRLQQASHTLLCPKELTTAPILGH